LFSSIGISTKTTFKFSKVVYRHYSGEVRTPIFLCCEFIQDTIHQTLSECFVEVMTKTFWLTFFFGVLCTSLCYFVIYKNIDK